MLKKLIGSTITLATLLAISPLVRAQADAKATAKSGATGDQSFDPHNLNGSWIGVKVFFGDENATPEPPLTQWAKEHLLIANISHPPLPSARNNGGKDNNGIPVNVPIGGYPGQRCDPIAAPAQFNYIGAYPIQFIMLPDRIYQMFENHREWRVFWLNRDHPKSVFPTYMGDSVAKWDGDTLVVDTIGFNGKDWISENLGQLMSDAFHLVERYHLTDATHMDLDSTYYDPKAWGDKPWPGWKKQFKLDSRGDSQEEQMCDPEHWNNYDQGFSDPVKDQTKK